MKKITRKSKRRTNQARRKLKASKEPRNTPPVNIGALMRRANKAGRAKEQK